MIIKASIIKATSRSMTNVVRHLLDKPDENEAIGIVSGSRQEVRIAFNDADRFNRKNAVAHFIFSSKEALTPDQMRDAVSMMKAEFGFSSDDIRLTVRHQKQRHDDGTAWDQHFHMLVSMVNPENGKVMDVSHSYARIEKVCRTFEAKHGLDIVSGKHDRAVIAAVEDPEIREKLQAAGIGDGKRPSAAFSSVTKERCKRQGIDVSDVKRDLRDAWSRCDGWQAFTAAIAGMGMVVRPGDKKPIPVIEKDGVVIGSASRLLGIKKADLERHMSVSGTEKAVEAIADAPTAPAADRTENASRSTQADDGRTEKKSPVPSVKAPHGGKQKAGDVGPGRVLSTIHVDLKGKSEQERNAEISTEKAEAEKVAIANKSLKESKQFYDDMLKMFSIKTGEGKMNTITLTDSFRMVCAGEIENFERIRDEPLPLEEMESYDKMTSKEKFEFANKKVLESIRKRKSEIRALEQEIKDLKSNTHWWNRNGTKADSKEAQNEERKAALQALCVWFARKLLSKFNVVDDPGPWRSHTPREWNEMVVSDREMRLAEVIDQVADMKETGYKKLTQEAVELLDESLEKWKNRPEVTNAKRQIVAIKSLLDDDEFAERVAELPDADKEKLIADIAGHDPCGAVKTLAAGENHAADIRDQERLKLEEIRKREQEQAEIREREQQKEKGQEQGKKGSELKIA